MNKRLEKALTFTVTSLKNQRKILGIAQKLHSMHLEREDLPGEVAELLESTGASLNQFDRLLTEQEKQLRVR